MKPQTTQCTYQTTGTYHEVINFNLHMFSSMCSKRKGKENLPPVKKPRLSLSLKNPSFNDTSEDKLINMSKAQVPKDTSVSTRWAMNNLTDWFEDYNNRNAEKCCPKDILLPSCQSELFSKWLCLFVTETQAQNGKKYRLKMVYSLLSAI